MTIKNDRKLSAYKLIILSYDDYLLIVRMKSDNKNLDNPLKVIKMKRFFFMKVKISKKI